MTTVLITGSNRGIGLEFVKQYLDRGYSVIAACRDIDSATELAEMSKGSAELRLLQLDVASEESMQNFAAALGNQAIDIFINNAGVYGPRDSQFGNVTSKGWIEALQINAVAPLLLTQRLIENLRQGADKKLIYITSKMGSIDDNHGGGAYVYRSSKTALNQVVKSLSVDLAGDGFITAVLHPGWVRTDMGGPNGLIDAETSIGGMISVIDELQPQKSGGFYAYDGAEIPW